MLKCQYLESTRVNSPNPRLESLIHLSLKILFSRIYFSMRYMIVKIDMYRKAIEQNLRNKKNHERLYQ
jgi:hypothetical protein